MMQPVFIRNGGKEEKKKRDRETVLHQCCCCMLLLSHDAREEGGGATRRRRWGLSTKVLKKPLRKIRNSDIISGAAETKVIYLSDHPSSAYSRTPVSCTGHMDSDRSQHVASNLFLNTVTLCLI